VWSATKLALMTRGPAPHSRQSDKALAYQYSMEALQYDRQPLKKKQTFPVNAVTPGGWSDSATQIQQ